MKNADKENINNFISKLEEDFLKNSISRQNLANECNITIEEYLMAIIQEAKNLIVYGEYKIAIENLLEEKITPPKETMKLIDIQDDDVKKLLDLFYNAPD